MRRSQRAFKAELVLERLASGELDSLVELVQMLDNVGQSQAQTAELGGWFTTQRLPRVLSLWQVVGQQLLLFTTPYGEEMWLFLEEEGLG